MSYNKLIAYIHDQKDVLDNIIASAGSDFCNEYKNNSNFAFDLEQCNIEALALSEKDDLCYDRPCTPLSYTIWYQGKRINAFLFYFSKLLFDSRDEESIQIFDLGAGAAAVQCACRVVLNGMESLGIKTPVVSIVNIDTSPLMLKYHYDFILPKMIKAFPLAKISSKYEVISWNRNPKDVYSNNWIVASYLFDHSENIDHVKEGFYNLVNSIQPNKLLLITAFRKRQFVKAVTDHLSKNYKSVVYENHSIYTGMMNKTAEFRKELHEEFGITVTNTPWWKDLNNWVHAELLENKNPIKKLAFDLPDSINLFNPPFVVRRDIILNEKQILASLDDGKPTIIVGPAGCGKSIVLSERIKNIIIDYSSKGKLSDVQILLTTFNKELETNLKKWIEELLSDKGFKIDQNYTHTYVTDKFGKQGAIQYYHFDVLPTKLGRIFGDIVFDYGLIQMLQKIIGTQHNKNYTITENDKCKNPEFLLQEYFRVWIGNNIQNKNEYLAVKRKGRGENLGSNQRNFIANVFIELEEELIRPRENREIRTTFAQRRKWLLKKIADGEVGPTFSHIFVDEFQDCTQMDYSIFYGLLKDNNNLVLAGDFAQSVHIGSVSDIPRLDNSDGERMLKRKTHELHGSYRLPYRITECIKPISRHIKLNNHAEASELIAYKGAPPGVRPILIYESNETEMAKRILEITNSYKSYGILNSEGITVDKITILEKDELLRNALNMLKTNIAESDTILRIKGLEKRCVVWSTKTIPENSDEIYNIAYTILTRTSCILIIALYPGLKENGSAILRILDSKRLLFWNQKSIDEYNKIKLI
jgi:DNA helicase-2/ATP-dependent DNA helicase PcrA